jgi:hypothetical protein
MDFALRLLSRLLILAGLAYILATGLAQAAAGGNGNGNGNNGAPGPLMGTGVEGLLLLGGGAYWLLRRARNKE